MGSYKLPITVMTYSATVWEDIWTIGEAGDLFPHSRATRRNSASALLRRIVAGYSRDILLHALLLVGAKKWKIRTGKTRLCRMGQCLTSVTLPCSWQSDAEGRNGPVPVGSLPGRAACAGQGGSSLSWEGDDQGPSQRSCWMGGTKKRWQKESFYFNIFLVKKKESKKDTIFSLPANK